MRSSDDRRTRRSHRSRSRSPTSSRSRRSSHHRSSKRRSRSRERSRRSNHSRRHRSRSRSRSRDRHKRRRRSSDDKKERRRSRSTSRSAPKVKKEKHNDQVETSPKGLTVERVKSIKMESQDDPMKEVPKPQEAEVKVTKLQRVEVKMLQNDQVENWSKGLKVESVKSEKNEVMESQDDPMEEALKPQKVEVKIAEPQGVEVKILQESKEEKNVEKTKQTNNVVSVESFDKQAPKTDKAAVDVSSIKADILKALADARSTIAGIKKNGPSTSASTTPKPIPVPAAITTDNEEEEYQGTLEVSEKQEEVVESPKKQLQVESSPKKQLEMEKSLTVLQKEEVTSPEKVSALPKQTTAVTDEFDMFSMAALDDHDDAMNGNSNVAAITVNEVSLQSNCDDADGYYSTTIGEVLNGKYRVLGAVGKGVFSTVLRCQCITPLNTANGSLDVVAVKLIRNNDVMRDAAQTELKLLNELGERDSRDKKHCIRLLDSFTHRNHVAMVFEPMQMNVREAMKKFGGKGGISIQAVRVFSKHLLIALNHLETCGVIHADIKPDNMLLDEKQTTIKLCDFGSAFKADDGKQDPTPYLVSRFYRAPEIVLGLAYDKAGARTMRCSNFLWSSRARSRIS
ncbi:hypothetical protein DVH05_019608 [Phytophthora capsici]|nr:hypothetical protein DVH05_019608 [Phytophthora capsici]